MTAAAAALFAILAAGVAGFHAAVAAGAPWGRLTLGGRWPGRLPPLGRAAAAVQAGLLAALALAMLGRAGVVGWRPPAWVPAAAVAVSALALAAHLATPARAERRLWAPGSAASPPAGRAWCRPGSLRRPHRSPRPPRGRRPTDAGLWRFGRPCRQAAGRAPGKSRGPRGGG